jgi:hypothetical protein
MAAGSGHGSLFFFVALLFFAVMMGVQLARFRAMMSGMRAMSRGAMGVMRRDIGIIVFVMAGGLAMMMCRLFVVLGGRVVMRAGGMLVRHAALLLTDNSTDTARAK